MRYIFLINNASMGYLLMNIKQILNIYYHLRMNPIMILFVLLLLPPILLNLSLFKTSPLKLLILICHVLILLYVIINLVDLIPHFPTTPLVNEVYQYSTLITRVWRITIEFFLNVKLTFLTLKNLRFKCFYIIDRMHFLSLRLLI